jgi:hypothetical protein
VLRRGVLALLPLLALFVVISAVAPQRPDDESAYVSLAHRLVHGRYVTGDQNALLDASPAYPDLWFGPGLPLVLTPLVALHSPLWLLRLIGPAALFVAVVLFYALVRIRGSPRLALAAAYALGLYPPALTLLSNLHSEPLALALVVAGMLGTTLYLRQPRIRFLALASVAFAWLALTRVEYGWIIAITLVGFLGWIAATRTPSAVRVAAVFALALVLSAPWLIYTHHVTGRPFVWGNSGSLSLFWMSAPVAGNRGDWQQASDVFTQPRLAPLRPFFASLRGLTIAKQNERIETRALRNIRSHPLNYAKNVGWNISRLVTDSPYSASGANWAKRLVYIVPNVLLLVATLVALVALRRGGRAGPPEMLVIVSLGVVALALHAAVSAYPRMLVPIVPVGLWLVATAVERRRERGLA